MVGVEEAIREYNPHITPTCNTFPYSLLTPSELFRGILGLGV